MGARKSKANKHALKPSKPNATQVLAMTVGDELRGARERMGATVEEAADELCLSTDFLNALEDDVYSKLPEPIYVRGYIRSYSRFLGLQGDALVEKYNSLLSEQAGGNEPGSQRTSTTVSSSMAATSNHKRYVIYLLSVLVIGLILVLSLLYWSESDYDGSPSIGLEKVSIEGADGRLILEDFSKEGGEVSSIVKTLLVKSTRSEKLSEVSAGEKNIFENFIDSLLVSVKEECWIQVTDRAGGTLHSALMSPGESLSLSGLAPFKVVVGNVHGVSINFNGEQVDLNSYQSRQSRVAVVKLGG